MITTHGLKGYEKASTLGAGAEAFSASWGRWHTIADIFAGHAQSILSQLRFDKAFDEVSDEGSPMCVLGVFRGPKVLPGTDKSPSRPPQTFSKKSIAPKIAFGNLRAPFPLVGQWTAFIQARPITDSDEEQE